MSVLAMIEAALGCCERPTLTTTRNLAFGRHGTCSLRRCEGCGQHWMYRCDEFDDFVGPTAVVIWYLALGSSEAEAVERAANAQQEATLPRRETHRFLYYEGELVFKRDTAEELPERTW
ncbi:MAG: hypothetical protein ACOYN0_10980 [Phycisphaerales bacterium]